MMVNVGSFCIDTTEVTHAQYGEFLKAKGSDVSGQLTPHCDWNATYQPAFFASGTTEAMNTGCSTANAFDPVGKANYPVSCIDWCDARAFCLWAGKRLCGAMGVGGPLDENTSGVDPQAAEWPFVATNGASDTSTYGPYGLDEKCVIGQVPKEPVKNRPLCHGSLPPFDAVYDLSGNVMELADDCKVGWGVPGPTNSCMAHGGSSGSSLTQATWKSYELEARNAVRGGMGFRCCANPIQ